MKKREQEVKKTTLYLDAEVMKKFKALCSLQGASMTAIIEELVRNWIKEQEERKDG